MTGRIAIAVASVLVASTAFAQPPAPPAETERRIEHVDEETLAARVTGTPFRLMGSMGVESDSRDGWRFGWSDHPTLDFGKVIHLDFRVRVQTHIRRSEAPLGTADESALDFARRRIGIRGGIANVADFQVERELQDDSDPWRDVFINLRPVEALQVQGGKFKLPFSLDENTSATNLDFVRRSLAANQLAPGRDVGVMMHGRVVRRRLRYELGIFNHDGRNARTSSESRVFGDRTVAGRLTVEPFRRSKSIARALQGGIAFTETDVPPGFASLRGRTTMDAAFFVPNFWVRGARRRIGVETRWQPGPFSMKSEYIHVGTERRGQSVEDSDLTPFQTTGWYLSGTWAATGERKADGLDAPRRPFLQGGAGALELAVRMEKLTFGRAATDALPSTSPRADVFSGNSDRAITVGVNWYLNRFIKAQANLIRETLTDPAAGPMPANPSFWSRVLRVQFSL